MSVEAVRERSLLNLPRLKAYLELTKPRVTTLVVFTTGVGFYLGSQGDLEWWRLLHTLLGTGLMAAGTAVLNQVLEREADGRMRRTSERPLPSGRLEVRGASLFGILLLGIGAVYLWGLVNSLTSLLGVLTAAVYLLVYTPLKTRTSLCTTVGALPGAIPPIMGWSGARGELDAHAWGLFLILFLWQFPHFWAISWLYREDYHRGGFLMLPGRDEEGGRTSLAICLTTLTLVVASFLPFWKGMAGMVYLSGALAGGLLFLWFALAIWRQPSKRAARHLLRMSVIYLPWLLLLMALDKT